MVEAILQKRNYSIRKRISIKTLISVVLVCISVGLPQIVHIVMGAKGGATFLPIYLPVIFGSLILGCKWGVVLGAFSPLISYVLTSCFGNAMPAEEKLLYMILELVTMGLIAGLFEKKVANNLLFSVVAVFITFFVGRLVHFAVFVIANSFTADSIALMWAQIKLSFWGIGLQMAIIPTVLTFIKK